MLALKAWQNENLVDLLEADSGKDDEKLISHMISEAKVTRETAESYLNSFRTNPKEGSIGVIVRAVHKSRKLESEADQRSKNKADTSTRPIPPVTAPIETEQPTQKPIHEPVPLPPDQPNPTRGEKKDPMFGKGIVAAILQLHEAGKSNQDIIAMGYNKSTVYRQIGEYKKRKAEAKKA
jgi:hypothetical protein